MAQGLALALYHKCCALQETAQIRQTTKADGDLHASLTKSYLQLYWGSAEGAFEGITWREIVSR